MPNSTVQVGAHTDTAPTYTVTINRLPADTITDLTAATSVVLLEDNLVTTHSVTKTSATASQWVGTIRYNAFFPAAGVYTTYARVTFADSSVETVPTEINFSVAL